MKNITLQIENFCDTDLILGLGSNIDSRHEYLKIARRLLSEEFKEIQTSYILETQAIVFPNSPKEWCNMPYLNQVIHYKSSKTAEDILRILKKIESHIGRDINSAKWSPREIDIDILIYGNRRISNELLEIPHSQIVTRDFIYPLLCDLKIIKELLA